MKASIPVLIQDQDNPCQWILVKTFYFWEGETLRMIPAGFVFDFASIPRLFWFFISPHELGDNGPLKHDWDYKNGKGKRSLRDSIFKADMIEDNIPAWKRNVAYSMVRMWGWLSWNSGKVVFKEVPNLEEVANEEDFRSDADAAIGL